MMVVTSQLVVTMPNALLHALSPYLRAHAMNPVDWRMWDDVTLADARRLDRPLFVSVGYFACHWCHVMAREAFSDVRVADLLNRNFVSIKVDREERPDIDQVLQLAHQALTGTGGGWPLSVFMDPQSMTPFFAGTYFPLETRYGRPGFAELLQRIVVLWRDRRGDLVAQGRVFEKHLHDHVASRAADAVPPASLAAKLVVDLEGAFDQRRGGFGYDGPKFPQCPLLAFLQARDEHAMLAPTLAAMRLGGLRDHVGGGFFRYTVDAAWQVPHFEKMLADNAQLLALYARAAARGDDAARAAALETAAFIEAELRLPDGGCATSLNAEAGGVEGGFYLWDRDEVHAMVGNSTWPAFATAFGLDGAPQVDGRWHLARQDAGQRDFSPELAALRAARANRVRPERDDKRLTSLNALLVTALATAALALDVPELGVRARALLELLDRTVVSADRVAAVVVGDTVYGTGLLADYAYLAEAALAVATLGDDGYAVRLAARLADAMLARFATATGGLALTPADAAVLLYRPRADRDDALPAPAGVAARVLLRLGHVLAKPRYLDAAAAVLRDAASTLAAASEQSATLLDVVAVWHEPPPLVVLRGEGTTRDWALEVTRTSPHAELVWLRGDVADVELARYAPRGKTVAYVCRGLACSAPIIEQRELQALLVTG